MSIKNTFIRDLCLGQQVHDLFLVTESRQGQSRNGPYWSLTIADRSGQMEAKVWSPLSQNFSEILSGSFAHLCGMVTQFRDRLQLIVEQLEFVTTSNESLNLIDFLPSSERSAEDMLQDIENLCNKNLRHRPWRHLTHNVLRNQEIRSRLMGWVGAKIVHHAYSGGLLEHTLGVVKLCISICEIYPQLDSQILLVAAVLHDLGKAWELSGGIVNDYTDQGRLLGHIWIGLEKLEPFFTQARDLNQNLALHLKHIILAHHGEYEFGSPKRPKTPEAFVLHYADSLDAKLNTIQTAFAELNPTGSPWTGYQRYLDRYLYRPKPTPNECTNIKETQQHTQYLLPIKN